MDKKKKKNNLSIKRKSMQLCRMGMRVSNLKIKEQYIRLFNPKEILYA